MQEWIDAIGKLGPLAVAVAVFLANQRQISWQNQATRRMAEVEDQKLRLALLDKRNVAIEKVREAVTQFWIEGAVRNDAAQATGQALRIAELVFDHAERTAIETFLGQLWQWQSLNRRLNSYRDSGRLGDDDRYQRVVDEMSDFESRLMTGFEPLLQQLIDATRLGQIGPLPEPARILGRIRKRLVRA